MATSLARSTMSNRLKVLLVEDNPGDARLIREMLTSDEYFGASYALEHVTGLLETARRCSAGNFDVILLDMNLPDSAGLSTVQHLNALAPQTPIVILTGLHDERVALQAVQFGAQDYLNKSECTGPLLKRSVHYAIERKRVEEHLRHLATHDALTGLPNRILFYDRLAQALHHSERSRRENSTKWKVAVMMLDLDHFKAINDSRGHGCGDAILQLAASRLKACLRESDTVARFGGDEFILIIEGLSGRADCLSVGQKILHALREPVILEGERVCFSASIGISIFPDTAGDIQSLIKYADLAMYSAKQHRGQIRLYEDGKQI